LLLIAAIAALAAPALAAGPATAAGPAEVLSARTQTSRLFDNRDGTFTLRQEIPTEWTTSAAIGWTSVYSRYPATSYWNGLNTSDGRANAGFNGWSAPTTVVRSFFQFDVGRVRGTRVLNAELSLFGSYSAAPCDSSPLVALRGTTAISPSTTWATQPSTISYQERPESSFCGGGRWIAFNVTGDVVSGADSGSPTATFGVGAQNENDRYAWRKYGTANTGQSPVLSITFEQPAKG
jgi:hypothetical protein